MEDGPETASGTRRRASFQERRERRAAVDDVNDVLEAAARFLEARPRSVHEVRRRLTTAGYRPELVDAAIGRLGELGYLDDDAFARTWVESRDRARPRGEHALRRELRLKGVDDAIVRTVLDDRRQAATTTPTTTTTQSGSTSIAWRPIGCWPGTPGPSLASPTSANAASGPTRCSRATGSTRPPPATWPAGSSTTARTSRAGDPDQASRTPAVVGRVDDRPLIVRHRFGNSVVG